MNRVFHGFNYRSAIPLLQVEESMRSGTAWPKSTASHLHQPLGFHDAFQSRQWGGRIPDMLAYKMSQHWNGPLRHDLQVGWQLGGRIGVLKLFPTPVQALRGAGRWENKAVMSQHHGRSVS